MRSLSTSSADGVQQLIFSVADVPAALWTPQGATGARPLILIGHGGGQHKTAPAVLHRAHRFVADLGAAVVSIDVPGHGDRPVHPDFHAAATANQARIDAGEDLITLLTAFQATVAEQTVPEWRAVLDAVQTLDHVGAGPVGYWGVSLGCGLGVPFVAAEPRVRAAVLGLGSGLANAGDAARITVPVEFLIQWDDERVPREQSLALYDTFASPEKTLHANPGLHSDRLPDHELDSTVRFFARHL
ncbi:alpha/beta hydrolase family protein [Actinoplanes sp. CA-252034]|uniref:alpha/beta hydrolase family protein n=1 Tax=Actinoplanes sp. CA-252034 TaxID=3239906 RepID=UPI003D983D1A